MYNFDMLTVGHVLLGISIILFLLSIALAVWVLHTVLNQQKEVEDLHSYEGEQPYVYYQKKEGEE